MNVIPYPIRLQEIPAEKIASAFNELLSNPDIKKALERRNKEVLMLQHLRAGTAESNSIVKRIIKADEKLASDMLTLLAAQ